MAGRMLQTAFTIVSVTAFLAWTARSGAAQSDSTSLTVIVHDQSGAAVPGATVVARHIATSAERDGSTDGSGRVTFTLLPPGDYEATVTLDGFKQFRDAVVRLQVAQPATLNVALEVGRV